MRRQPLVAALLSALIPGAGQLYSGDPFRGVIVFSPTILVISGLYSLTEKGTIGAAELLVQPRFLTALITANALVLAWRIAASIDAYRITTRERERGVGSVAVLAVMLAVLALPQMVGWVYGAETIDAINTVFVVSTVDETDPTPASSTTTFPDVDLGAGQNHPGLVNLPEIDPLSTANMIFRQGFGDPDAITALGDILAPPNPTEAPFVPFDQRVDPDRLTILLVGGDAGPGREGLRTDSMNVVTIDMDTGAVAMFGIPRNLKLAPLPANLRTSFLEYEELVIERDTTDRDLDGFPDSWEDEDGDGTPDEPEFESCECFPEMLNKVYGKTHEWDSRYPHTPDPGLAALRDVVSHMLDIPIDYYFMVEMAGFVRTIDIIGGVDVLVQEPYHVKVSSPEEGQPKATINVEPGMNRLTGLEALAYTRWRIGSSDYDRMGRQRCVIKAAATQADTLTIARSFPDLLDVMRTYVTTDIPVAFLPDLVRIAGEIDYDNIATVGLTPPTYTSGRTPGHYPIPDVDRMRWKVRQVIEEGTPAQSSTGESECG